MVMCRIVNAFSSLFGYQRAVRFLIDILEFSGCSPERGEREWFRLGWTVAGAKVMVGEICSKSVSLGPLGVW